MLTTGLRSKVVLSWRGAPGAGAVAAVLLDPRCAANRLSVFPASAGDEHRLTITGELGTSPTEATPLPPVREALEEVRTAQGARPVGPATIPVLDGDHAGFGVWGTPDAARLLSMGDLTEIYRLLDRIGFSTAEISTMTHQSKSEVRDILHGQTVSASELVKAAAGLGVPPMLLRGEWR